MGIVDMVGQEARSKKQEAKIKMAGNDDSFHCG
jgi:hypothetical protein